MTLKGRLLIVFFLAVPVLVSAQRKVQQVYRSAPGRVDVRYRKGCELYEKEMFAAALLELEEALRDLTDPLERQRAEYYAARSRAILQQEFAVQILTEYIGLAEDAVFRDEATVILAENYLLLEETGQAAALVAGVDPKKLDDETRSTYNYIQAYLALQDGEVERARSLFLVCSVDGKSRHKVDATYYLGYIAYLDGDYEKALKAFAEALEHGGVYAKSEVYIAQIRFMQGDYDYVIENREALLRHQSNKLFLAEVNRMVAASYYHRKDYVSTIDYMGRFESLGGKMGRQEQYMLGYSYYMMNNYARAIERLTAIVDGGDKLSQNAYYLLADSYLKTNDKAGAIKAFSMAASMDFDREIAEDALYNYVKLTYELDEGPIYSRKIDVLKRYTDKYRGSKHYDEISGYLLNLYINSADYASAIELSKEVKNPGIEVRRALQRAFYDQGILCYEAKKYDEAIGMFRKAMVYDAGPKYYALSQYWIAESMYARGDYNNDVIWLYKKYLNLSNPELREYQLALYGIAYTYFNTEQWGFAITWFRNFLEAYKQDDALVQDAYVRLGDSWFARRDYKRAAEHYLHARTLAPDDYADYQLAITYGISGNNPGKIAELKKIVESGKSAYHEEASMELASTYLKTNRFKEARQVLEQLLAQRPNSIYVPRALLQVGVADINLGEEKAALDAYAKVVKQYPESQEAQGALIAMRSIYVSQGNVEPYFAFVNGLKNVPQVDASEKEQITYDALLHLYTNKEFERAEEAAGRYLKSFPNGKHLADVTYFSADAAARLGKTADALRGYEKVMAMPLNPYSAAAYGAAAETYLHAKEYGKGYKALYAVYKYGADPVQRREALEKAMAAALMSEDSASIREAYAQVLETKNIGGDAVNMARYARGKDRYLSGEYRKAADDLEKVTLSANDEIGAEALYLLAASYAGQEKHADVEKTVMKLAKGNTPHQHWVAKGFILLGDSYLAQGDRFQARATYNSVADGYDREDDGVKAEARRKLEALGEEEESITQ